MSVYKSIMFHYCLVTDTTVSVTMWKQSFLHIQYNAKSAFSYLERPFWKDSMLCGEKSIVVWMKGKNRENSVS